MNGMTLFRAKNQIMGRLATRQTAQLAAELFLNPRNPPLKPWEAEVEQSCQRVSFGNDLKAAIWGEGEKKVLLVHGWESRATHMAAFVKPLLDNGFQVIAIDGPKHGQSGGDKANPVAFSQAVLTAEVEFGPFEAAIGHSMGSAALCYALELGVSIPNLVLISSPATILSVLKGFAGFIGLPKDCGQVFIKRIEEEVGVAAEELDVGRILEKHKPRTLLIHSADDKEIPIKALYNLAKAYPVADVFVTEELGHRRIIRDREVSQRVTDFVSNKGAKAN